MFYVKTGDVKLDAMIKAIASRHIDPSSSKLAVCSAEEVIPPYAESLIIIHTDALYTSGKLHRKYRADFGKNYVSIQTPVSIRKLEDALRKFSSTHESNAHQNTVIYDDEKRILSNGDTSVTLTEKEAQLYLLLRENHGKAVSRYELRRRLWEDTDGTNAPDVCVSYLRRKLSAVLGDGALINVRGVGYLLRED